MRKICYWLPVLCVLMASCHDMVTDIDPENRINTNQVFSTAANMNTAVVGCYNSLQAGDMLQARALVLADVMGEDLVNRTNNFGDIARYNALSSNTMAARTWQAGYKAIADANRVIDGISKNVDKTTPEQAQRWMAECKFVRAIAHFYLVNLYAQSYGFTADASHPGIPVMTQAFYSNDPAANKPRSSVKQVYDQIITDLKDALDTLPLSNNTPYQSKTRATKAAAAAMLSRVYLYKDDVENAKNYAWAVINKQYGDFGLNTEPSQCYGAGNYLTKESIFSIPSKAGDFEVGYTLTANYTTNVDLGVSPDFLNVLTNPWLAADDKRRTQLIALHPVQQVMVSLKYRDVADWAPVIRYAEVLLNYAEAAAKAPGTAPQEVLIRLNEVRNRSRVSALPYTNMLLADKTQLLNAILAERRIELAFEGHRIFDLNRNKLRITGKRDFDYNTFLPAQDYGADKRILPIPLVEMERSGGVLEKNPGY
ncbi:RagB/SusD family nutrient uptake outer membrane protein [Chitinophaga sedimenti]|uniref:RagB/SusD family nutrient uptake outer membrane protein n=1 Tax=Chitinophaga sedimenti TaxID=2033606 RepID=UPI002005A6F5|nr:RagB/SusD family nutrient uptake outer membrane protein [Chitinophaga sedimenti]MCK7555179.1 RagB/SusD family nutrient uptake outer membrane protein [Chitinophaga sedimenti]